MSSPVSKRVYRFAGFEVDRDSGEVRKRGIRIRVQEQPLRLLGALLERPRVLITREELHRTLWPDDTFVDFEHGLNAAVTRLRQALGDSAQTPRFIESVPRRGYRFIATVETGTVNSEEPVAVEEPEPRDEAFASPNGNLVEPGAHPDRRERILELSRHLTPWALTTMFLAVAAIVSWLHFRERPREDRSFKFSVLPPEGTTFPHLDPIALSPDGRLMAFPAKDRSGETQLWLRPLDGLTAGRLDGTNGASFPFWSPDSRTIGFFANGKLKRVEAAGGPPRTICEAAEGRGGSWNRAGAIIFAPALGSPLFQVSSAGGEPKPVTSLDASRRELSHRWPFFLPDGQHFIYVIRTARPEDSGIYVGSIAGGRNLFLLRNMSNAAYANDRSGAGYLLFMQGDTLVGRPFDAGRLRMAGEQFPIAQFLRRAANLEPAHAEFSVSDAGVLAYQTQRGTDQLTWFDRNGTRLETIGEPGFHVVLSLSPNEKDVVFSQRNRGRDTFDVWRMDRTGSMPLRLTYGPGAQHSPVWSPDGSRVAYSSFQGSAGDLYESPSSGGGEKKLLWKSGEFKLPTDWSADGRFLLYQEFHSGTKRNIWALPMVDGGKPVELLRSRFAEVDAVFSPDGKWLAYGSDETGKLEVYVAPFSLAFPPARKWIVSQGGGSHPKWPGNGKELYYLAPDKRIMAVEVTTQGGFRSGVPRALFQSDIIDDFRVRFAVTADGRRFLIPSGAGQAGSPSFTVVVNWKGIKE